MCKSCFKEHVFCSTQQPDVGEPQVDFICFELGGLSDSSRSLIKIDIVPFQAVELGIGD